LASSTSTSTTYPMALKVLATSCCSTDGLTRALLRKLPILPMLSSFRVSPFLCTPPSLPPSPPRAASPSVTWLRWMTSPGPGALFSPPPSTKAPDAPSTSSPPPWAPLVALGRTEPGCARGGRPSAARLPPRDAIARAVPVPPYAPPSPCGPVAVTKFWSEVASSADGPLKAAVITCSCVASGQIMLISRQVSLMSPVTISIS